MQKWWWPINFGNLCRGLWRTIQTPLQTFCLIFRLLHREWICILFCRCDCSNHGKSYRNRFDKFIWFDDFLARFRSSRLHQTLFWEIIRSIYPKVSQSLNTIKDTVEGSNVILLNFFLEKELSEHEPSFRIFVDCTIINTSFDSFEFIIISESTVKFALCLAIFVGFKGLPDSKGGYVFGWQKGKHDKIVWTLIVRDSRIILNAR